MTDANGQSTIWRDDPDIHMLQPDCIISDLGHFCPGGFFGVADNDGFILVLMSSGRSGVHFRFTPFGARAIAQQLLDAAAEVEVIAQTAANAQLAATFANKGQPE